ncbi:MULTISPECIES: OprD family outer membrane porin [unclassified Lentimonas]|uniref:OprD family outer membrane porin n=1 Tax=unclassified Lentimonas TaxID=2630993 RepID=UPI001321F843|nr:MULTISPECIES: OprD family outer membrane porin [unclassified Lentimonas]CAA6676676.1 Unannotated [Lentimonas sp. CC4]CAA6684660.1 Unannotated [Lentimonas sp. CC6]CAA7075295.1 Unannotated [Lentimonas sp. CC4]CAA7170681.1 Unannotated [Lentimonas sp. CC21]CAA7182296.1 Unannotated [Lentimonas sp. CC8]
MQRTQPRSISQLQCILLCIACSVLTSLSASEVVDSSDTPSAEAPVAQEANPETPSTPLSSGLDESSERVGFGTKTSPLDQPIDADKPNAPEQTSLTSATAATTEQAEATLAAETTPAKPEVVLPFKKPAATAPIQSDTSAVTIDAPDDSSERVGFNQDSSPLTQEAERLDEKLHHTGVPFIDNTTYFIAPRAYYRYYDSGNGDTSEAFAIGGGLGLKSGMYQDFASIRLTAHTSQKVMSSSDDQDDDDSAGLLRGNNGYTVITEANLNLKIRDADFRLGIQLIDLPYINSNDSRMVPNTFEAYTIRSTPDSDKALKYGLGYVHGMRERTGSDFESLSEQAGAENSDEGIYTFGLHYKLNENSNVGFVELNNPNTLNVFYLETNATLPLFDLIHLDAGFQFSDQRSIGNELIGSVSTQQYGVKLRASYEKLVSTLVFTHTGSDEKMLTPWGGSPSFNSMMISDFDRAGEKAIGGSLSYRFSGKADEGFVTSMRWTYGNTPDSGSNASPDQYEVNWNFDYYPKSIPNLWFRLRTAKNHQDGSDGDDAEDVRFIVNYVKTF